MKKQFGSLHDYKVKKHALIMAGAFFLLDKILYVSLGWKASTHSAHILFNYMVALGLMVAINSKDKVDDERSVLIRYGILKKTIGLFVLIFGAIALFSKDFGIENLSLLAILYCIEGILALHLLFLFLANKFNPAWLFRETTVPHNRSQIMIGFFYGFLILSALIVIASFFIHSL